MRFLRCVFVPEDETCFYLYEAGSLDAVREAARRAALPFGGVAEMARAESTKGMKAAGVTVEGERR